MTQAADAAGAGRRSDDVRLIASISAAHFVSHFYILTLPPLFAFVRADYDVSYTEIGLALTVFNAVSAVLQTPAGFLVDRFNARLLLVAGLVLGATGLLVAAAVDSFWVLVLMFGLMGLGNTIYHPADYSLLSRHVAGERMSQAFSTHTFAGLLGTAAAPGAMLLMYGLYGWRGAFVGSALLGLAVAAFLLMQRDAPAIGESRPQPHGDASAAAAPAAAQVSWRILLSWTILANFVFFMLMALGNFTLSNFSVVALGALYGTPAVSANAALSSFLFLGAAGVLFGGWLAGRTQRHTLVAVVGMIVFALVSLLIAAIDLPIVLLILLMSLSGFCNGAILPSRDLLVREATPDGAFGKVFGFVTNGFNIAGILSPLIGGALMDHGEPRAVFVFIGACAVLGAVTVAVAARRPVEAV